MTSRPLGSRQAPQRSLSSNLIQRPPPQRTPSQQFFPSSPARRNHEAFGDLTIDGSDAGRGGNTPRNGGSRLKLEISKDSTPSLVESPAPTSDATPTWRPSAPPRGRPQLHFDVPSISNRSPRATQGGQTPTPIKPMPLPVRPGQHAPPAVDKTRAAPANNAKKDARPKPYTLEVPAAAPHYLPNGGHADFFPWIGNHPEDQFSETAIRQGFFDKAQMTQNETGSAKSSLFPALKHKAGLQTLSSLFANVLAQRRGRGQITSASTFKPPPRVTVTDTKREMWLKDLANPEISLRRLSRSIPHGIRGKILLEQSLSKNIPIERAIWLAKCVGANELRSFRRKGATGTFAMGGEAKWIRDFTVCVEQFVESIVSTCGEQDFRSRLNYAIRLAAHFYAEHLLDREHYMDWLVSLLENSPQPKLPMWLLLTQIYWKDLLKYRKYGRRLSAALMNQLAETVNHPDHDILAPLSDRLHDLIKRMMESNPESFLYPSIWAKHKDIIQSSLGADSTHFSALFNSIDQRNARFACRGSGQELPSRRRLIQLLDATLERPLATDLPKVCWQIDGDISMIMQTILAWSSSSHRPGNTKTFVAARILRFFSRSGADVSEAILKFVDSKSSDVGFDKPAFYHLASELVRSEHFSVASYLQWLIARGGIYSAAEIARDGPCATRLLVELPTHNLSESMISLRRTLLGRAGFSIDQEEDGISSCMVLLNQSLPAMQAHMGGDLDIDVDNKRTPDGFPAQLSRSIKSEIGLWLRQTVQLLVVQPPIPPIDEWDNSTTKGGTSAITASDFNTVRQFLETTEDHSMLADVLKIATSSNDPDVLASCADTLDLHLNTFAAIGALKGIFDILVARLRSLSDDLDSIPRVFLVALSDLAARIPEQNIIAQQLAQELARSDRKTAADACSPVSDHMALMQTAEADFTDEIEKVLASGNSMDQATLERLFQRIALRLEESWTKSPEQHRSCGLLFTRLRTFDAQQFDLLMAAWVDRFIQMTDRPSMIHVLGPLISFGCINLSNVVVNGGTIFEKLDTGDPAKVDIARELMCLVIAPSNLPEVMTPEEAYRLRIKQSHLQKDNLMEIVTLIRRAFENVENKTGSALFPALVYADPLATYKLLQRIVLADAGSMTKNLVLPLLNSGDERISSSAVAMVDWLVVGERCEGGAKPIAIEAVLNLADDFTLPFCHVKLASMFALEDASMQETEDDGLDHGSERLAALDVAIETAVAAQNTSWTCIVPLLDSSITQHIRHRAETQFLAGFPSPKALNTEESMPSRVQRAEHLLFIVEVTSNIVSSSSTASTLASEIVSTLRDLWHLLSNVQIDEMKAQVIAKWIPLLLSFITLQSSVFDTADTGHENHAKAVLALAALLLQLQALDTGKESVTILIEQTFDLALYLIDSLPDDMRQNCIRSLRDTVSNPRISYLFSIAANPSEWLVLSQKEKGPPIPPGLTGPEARAMIVPEKEKISPFPLRRWEMLGEPTPNVGENDTSLSLTLFGARRG
ncbi:Mediator of RNA polymerase II transcription subunit 12 [Hyphodiscus hymeniophilus]|uniref:Mediator of RNA polymerase II transcription subunit 12 n=1 Tax=Hyphodiscus hymeniophilus TaxID=353542 RepID=A0A9P6VMS8_9HELO|nr:Mediator of RNA polymerase II transcription subunit 12 [Hyphodiscus hymeniophilus]